MAAISKVISLSQNLRGAEPPVLILCIGFVGRRCQKKYCQIHHAIMSAILEAIFQKMAAFFPKVIRVIFENMAIVPRDCLPPRVNKGLVLPCLYVAEK